MWCRLTAHLPNNRKLSLHHYSCPQFFLSSYWLLSQMSKRSWPTGWKQENWCIFLHLCINILFRCQNCWPAFPTSDGSQDSDGCCRSFMIASLVVSFYIISSPEYISIVLFRSTNLILCGRRGRLLFYTVNGKIRAVLFSFILSIASRNVNQHKWKFHTI